MPKNGPSSYRPWAHPGQKLMMESEIESSTEDSEPEVMIQVPEETQKNQQKKIKQKQRTDIFQSQK